MKYSVRLIGTSECCYRFIKKVGTIFHSKWSNKNDYMTGNILHY